MSSTVAPPFTDPAIQAIFDAFPADVRRRMLELRALIFSTADELAGVGAVEETLRWAEPTYLTPVSKSGTMIRLNSKDPDGRRVGLYVHCQTDLVETFRARHGEQLVYEGKRAVLVDVDGALPREALRDCIALALTYRVRKAAERRRGGGAASGR